MKNISSVKTCLLAALVFSSPFCNSSDRNTQKKIAGAVFIAGTAAFVAFGAPYLMKTYHANEMLQMRTQLANSNTLGHDNICENENDNAIKSELANKKEALLNSWKTNYQRGISISGSQNFSGQFDIANALSLHLSVSGAGILTNCFSRNSTELNGDVIVHSSQLQDVTINNPTALTSFNNCLLKNVRHNGTGTPRIELLDTIVDGNITFDKPGIVIVNETTLISGSIINGKIIRS